MTHLVQNCVQAGLLQSCILGAQECTPGQSEALIEGKFSLPVEKGDLVLIGNNLEQFKNFKSSSCY